MFTPPRCPFTDCSNHEAPTEDFFVRRGYYSTRCQPRPIPRFQCRECQRRFSRQTFRHDYRDRKPHLNVQVIELLCSGVGYRQSARIVRMTRKNLVNKARKIQRTAGRLNDNLLKRAGDVDKATPRDVPLELQFDEFETYELCRNTMPLSVPTVVEPNSRLILGSHSAPIRPKGTMTEQRQARVDRHEELYGPRVDQSADACRRVLGRAAAFRPAASVVHIGTDCKTAYPRLIENAFEGRDVTHEQTLGSAPRGPGSKLAAINLTEAMMRDLTGRVRRESWLVSKRFKYLNLHLGLYVAWRNWVRPRFNKDKWCPGQLAGLAECRLKRARLVGWRQDWGQRSPSPYDDGSKTVGQLWGALPALSA